MKLELTFAGLLVKLANHYTTRGSLSTGVIVPEQFLGKTVLFKFIRIQKPLKKQKTHCRHVILLKVLLFYRDAVVVFYSSNRQCNYQG